jgi:hypothetical protein
LCRVFIAPRRLRHAAPFRQLPLRDRAPNELKASWTRPQRSVRERVRQARRAKNRFVTLAPPVLTRIDTVRRPRAVRGIFHPQMAMPSSKNFVLSLIGRPAIFPLHPIWPLVTGSPVAFCCTSMPTPKSFPRRATPVVAALFTAMPAFGAEVGPPVAGWGLLPGGAEPPPPFDVAPEEGWEAIVDGCVCDGWPDGVDELVDEAFVSEGAELVWPAWLAGSFRSNERVPLSGATSEWSTPLSVYSVPTR